MANGGIIGTVNTPTSSTATGVWQQQEQYEAKVTDTWPQRALFTTNSLRFDDGSSDYLTEAVSSTSNRKTFTYSAWIKRSSLSGSGYPRLFNPYVSNSNFFDIFFRDSDALNVYSENGGSNDMNLVTNRLFKDLSAWYHIVVAVDTTQGTDSNRVKVYINGTQETSFSASTYPSVNTDFQINLNTVTNVIGRNQAGSNNYFDGYMAEVILVDGQALTPTSFGVSNSDEVWTPIPYTGTFGTNGFNLQFQNSAALGTDSSPNGNTFTVNNLTSIDQSTDYPEVNFATWNPSWSQSNGNIGDVVFSEGNLKTTTSANYRTYPTTIGFSSGKWYWEIKRYEDDGSNDMHTGVMSELATPANTATWIGNAANGWVFACDNGSTYTGGTESNTGYTAAPNAGDIVQVAFDADNGKIYFGVNGTWQNSGNPATGTNPAYTGLDTSLFYFPCASTGSDVEGNFGSPSYSISSGNADGNGYGNMEYAVPSGYYSINTKNLAEFG